MPKFTIISDIHLEFIPHLDRFADDFSGENLLLCGDIGKPHTKIFNIFLEHCSTKFDRVFILCGNHEYYGHTMDNIEKEMERIKNKYQNVYFMNTCSLEFDDFIIAGTTLWSNIPPSIYDEIAKLINDYRYIYKSKGVTIRPQDTTRLHHLQLQFLREELANAVEKEKPLVFMTHHAPLFNCVKPEYLTNKNHAFCSDLHELFKPPLRLWAFGHTHCPFQMDLPVGDSVGSEEGPMLRLHNNPVGYPHELDNYNPFDLKNCTFEF